ncbi:hypothetical protein SUFG_00040 [Sulfitobacter phage phiCB2047-B]|uniref:Thioredoxin domain-containing protein n=1 Tax=Sulfitobacter phage phiCB2047-B TaxID=754046 RepID=M4PMS7_9CAUD|nr:hypothetical protein SUFG_00040 [Sulfitobacter phage phiCB2047-B]AGH07407.1 hypothetical protein SUFG_00040 [Sulfitobacter phage phiCB2047-B]
MLKQLTDESFQEEVREAENPVIVMFTGPNCHACNNMKPVVEELSNQMTGDITFLVADVQEASMAAADLSIRSLPSMALFVDGMVRDITSGSYTKNNFRLWIQDNI